MELECVVDCVVWFLVCDWALADSVSGFGMTAVNAILDNMLYDTIITLKFSFF